MHDTLLVDLGNTRLKFAVLRADGRVEAHGAVAHADGALPDGWADALPGGYARAVVASVAAPALRAEAMGTLAGRCPVVVRATTLPALAGLRVGYPDPSTLGVDRFLAMLGARRRDTRACLVVGVGTALTLDLVDGDGQHHGGLIAPSPALMREALHARAAQLPPDGGAFTDFGLTTPDALRAGCDGAALALIERTRATAAARLGAVPRLLLHGGGAAGLAGLPDDAVHAPSLVLDGLATWVGAVLAD